MARLPRSWVRRAILVCGVALIVRGLWPVSPTAAPRQVVVSFVEALGRGDRTAALRWLGPQARERVDLYAAPEVWTASKSFQWTIRDVSVKGSTALAHVRLRDHGMYIDPEFELAQRPDGQWEISSLLIDQVDPRYAEKIRKDADEADEKLADEIRSALRGSPAVLAERPDDERSR